VQVISPWPPLHMFDGLESARSREPGHSEHVTIALARPACIGRIAIDFTHFVNNNPRELVVEGRAGDRWVTLVPRTSVKAYAGNAAAWVVHEPTNCDQIRVTAYPDGGMNRIHVFEATP
jgi:allantoicase